MPSLQPTNSKKRMARSAHLFSDPPMDLEPDAPDSEDIDDIIARDANELDISDRRRERRERQEELSQGLNAIRRDNNGISDPDHVHQFPESVPQVPLEGLAFPSDSVPRQFTPWNPDSCDWASIEEAPHDPEDDSYCGLCDHAQDETQQEANPALDKIRNHYQEHLLEVKREKLAQQCVKLYDRYIKKYTPAKRHMTARMLSEHEEQHAPTPQTIKVIDFRMYSRAMRVMRENKIFRKDQDGLEDVDGANIRLYMQISKERDRLLGDVYASKASKKQKV